MKDFDPSGAAPEDSGIFGLPFSVNESSIVLLPVPWEATTSYGKGTSRGPDAIFKASKQVDLYDVELGKFYESGIAMEAAPKELHTWNERATDATVNEINSLSIKINDHVRKETTKFLSQGKIVGVVGGDHSTPFGAIEAYVEKYPQMGILHFDAHADLRKAYEGYEHSHASIMYNVMTKTKLNKLVQVGIRDLCEDEFLFIRENKKRISTHFDSVLAEHKMAGKNWSVLCDEIVRELPKEVYISFDIDGLDPRYCPHTGTPVPGGLDFHEALLLIKKVVKSDRKIVGFDLNEVVPGPNGDEWDANVGARLLYKLCGWSLAH